MNENDRYGDPPKWHDGLVVPGMIVLTIILVAYGIAHAAPQSDSDRLRWAEKDIWKLEDRVQALEDRVKMLEARP